MCVADLLSFVRIYFILCHFNQSRARKKDCWPGCPLDHQVNFSGWQQDFLVVRILRHKKSQIQPPKAIILTYHISSI